MLEYNTSMKEKNSFEHLVSTISKEERDSLLKKLKESEKPEEQIVVIVDDTKNSTDTIHELFKKESFFLRIYLYIKSFFVSENIEQVYQGLLLKGSALNIEKNFGNLLNYKEKTFNSGLYHQIYQLSLVAQYFKPSIDAFDDDRSAFFINLSSIVVPELAKRMDNEANPFNSKGKPEDQIARRNAYSKKVDEIINSISLDEKNTILAGIRSVEWLLAFCEIPFEKLLSKFTAKANSEYSIAMEMISKELSLLARVLSTNIRFPIEMFEVFYLLSNKKTTAAEQDLEESSPDLSQEEAMKAFITQGAEQIQLIKTFSQSVPIIEITRLAFKSILWNPSPLEKTESWLSQLKMYWKKLFDETWDKWLVSVKKDILIKKMQELIGTKANLSLPFKPWEKTDEPFSFQLEQSLAFLTVFFKECHPKHAKVLKEVLLNGEFIQRDNKTEFTDTYNALEHIEKSIHKLNEKLSFKGNYGQAFSQLNKNLLVTIQGQAKLKSLMNSLKTEMQTLIEHFASACRSMSSLIGGILHEEKSPRYTTLKNISEIWGNKNLDFRKDLQESRKTFLEALEIIKELDSLSLLETSVNN